MFWFALLVVLTILLIYCVIHKETRGYVVHGMLVNVISDYENKDEAMKLVLKCNRRMIKLLDHLRVKYKIGITDEECGGACSEWIAAHHREREFIVHLLRDFNYEAIHENRPKPGISKNVAYSLDKGRTIMLCLRGDREQNKIVDIDTLMFVVLHEAAHIANYDQWGHEAQFWQVFKYLLKEAVSVGVYEPSDYAKHPRNYCGFTLNHNPYFDSRIAAIV